MAPFLEQANLSNALNFNFPLGIRPTDGSAFWPPYPANTTAMAVTGRDLPLPKRRRPGPPGRVGHRPAMPSAPVRAPTAARPPPPTGRSSSARASMASLLDGIEHDRRGLREPAGDRRAVVHPDLAHAGPLAPSPGDGPRRRRAPDRCLVPGGLERLAAEQGGGLVRRQLPEHPLQSSPDPELPGARLHHLPQPRLEGRPEPAPRRGQRRLRRRPRRHRQEHRSPPDVWRAIATRGPGGEVVSADAF